MSNGHSLLLCSFFSSERESTNKRARELKVRDERPQKKDDVIEERTLLVSTEPDVHGRPSGGVSVLQLWRKGVELPLPRKPPVAAASHLAC